MLPTAGWFAHFGMTQSWIQSWFANESRSCYCVVCGCPTSLPWQDLVPDQDHTVVTAGLGNYGNLQTRVSQSDYCTASKTPDGAFVVAYMPTERTITVNMAGLKGPAEARWFDPTNGAYTAVPGGPFVNMGTRQFTPPGKNHDGEGDWVLLLNGLGSTDP